MGLILPEHRTYQSVAPAGTPVQFHGKPCYQPIPGVTKISLKPDIMGRSVFLDENSNSYLESNFEADLQFASILPAHTYKPRPHSDRMVFRLILTYLFVVKSYTIHTIRSFTSYDFINLKETAIDDQGAADQSTTGNCYRTI